MASKVNTRNDGVQLTLNRTQDRNVNHSQQNLTSKSGMSHHQSMDNIEIQNMLKESGLEKRDWMVRNQLKRQYPTSTIHKLATAKDISYKPNQPRATSQDEVESTIESTWTKKINQIKFEPKHYQRDRSEGYLIRNGNGANGRSQFLQSPGLPGFTNKIQSK